MNDKIFIISTLRATLTGCLRIIILLIFVSLIGSLSNGRVLFAQDIIFLKNGDEIKSSVTEIGFDVIKYKKYENLAGPEYTLEKNKVFMIKYVNGTKDVFNTVNEAQPDVIQKKEPPVSSFTSREPVTSNGTKVYQGNEKLSPAEVRRLFSPIPDALHNYNSARVLNGFDWAVEIVGVTGFLVLYMEEAVWPAWGVLLTAAIGSGILLHFSNKNIKSSISLYNFNISQVSYKVNFGIQENGIGFALRF
jgi:hypothetical protein